MPEGQNKTEQARHWAQTPHSAGDTIENGDQIPGDHEICMYEALGAVKVLGMMIAHLAAGQQRQLH